MLDEVIRSTIERVDKHHKWPLMEEDIEEVVLYFFEELSQLSPTHVLGIVGAGLTIATRRAEKRSEDSEDRAAL